MTVFSRTSPMIVAYSIQPRGSSQGTILASVLSPERVSWLPIGENPQRDARGSCASSSQVSSHDQSAVGI